LQQRGLESHRCVEQRVAAYRRRLRCLEVAPTRYQLPLVNAFTESTRGMVRMRALS
jgi:hypothetical protein